MEIKRCILCNKPFNHNYNLFGRGCLDNLYNILEISQPPRIIRNKEKYLCNKIARRNHKYFLGKNKKINLTKKYIALKYLEKMKYKSLDDIRNKILDDIKSISLFTNNIMENISVNLNEIYLVFNSSKKFDEIINNITELDLEKLDEKTAEEFLKTMSFIFDISKKSSPIQYRVYYSMQYIFWQTVVAGGLLANLKLSSKLLLNSICEIGKKPNDLKIDDENINKQILESEEFKTKIKELTTKYCKNKTKFNGNSKDNEDFKIEFNNSDLFLAIHGASIKIAIEKNENETLNIDMEITDTYDFTDFKNIKKYATSNKSLPLSIFSSLLNNFAVMSSEYGVIKPYKVTIMVHTKDYKIS